MTPTFLEKHVARLKARGKQDMAPLFAAFAAELRQEQPAPVPTPAPLPAPEAPQLRAQDYAVREQPAPVVSGPCPVMRQARADLEGMADRIVEGATVGLNLSTGALQLYRLLVVAGLGRLVDQGIQRRPDVVELHMPGELLALLLGVHRTTVWRWARELDAAPDEATGEVAGAGLIARHDHKSTSGNPYGAQAALDAHERRTGPQKRRRHVSDGLVWAVSLRGPVAGLQVSYAAKCHEWRDLQGDARATHRAASKATEGGAYTYSQDALNTVWAMKNVGLQQSLVGLKATKEEEIAIRWAVNPGFRSPPPSQMTVASALPASQTAIWEILTLPGLSRHERGAAVDAAASRLAAALGDLGSVGLYRWVLWRAFRLDVEGRSVWDMVATILSAVHSEAREGECKTPGAVFIHRLRRAGLWEDMKGVALYRVGGKVAA